VICISLRVIFSFQAVDAGDIMDHTQYKAQGNEYFKSGNFEEAIVCYTKALDISAKQGSADTSFKGVVHSNKSACYLKTGKPQLALQEATKCELICDTFDINFLCTI